MNKNFSLSVDSSKKYCGAVKQNRSYHVDLSANMNFIKKHAEFHMNSNPIIVDSNKVHNNISFVYDDACDASPCYLFGCMRFSCSGAQILTHFGWCG